MVFFQLLINSLIIGSIYALVACGFSLIYTANKFMHFAHGASIALAAYFLYLFYNVWHIPFFLACIATLIATSLTGLAMNKWVYMPLLKKKSSNVIMLIASVALLIFFENLILLIAGADVKTIGYIPVREGLKVLGASITPLQIVIICTSLILFIALKLFLSKTKYGKQIRAVANNKELSQIIGLNPKKISYMTFIIGSLLAGIAGILIGLEQNLQPTMGTNLMIKGFSGAVIGGVASIPGSILGSYILGIAENYGIWYLPSGYKDAIAFTLLFIFLLVKPKGLISFGRGDRDD